MQKYQDTALFESNGALRVLGVAMVTVYRTGSSTLAPIYSDIAGTPMSNPFNTDASGNVSFYAEGTVDVVMAKAGYSSVTKAGIPVGNALAPSVTDYATEAAALTAAAGKALRYPSGDYTSSGTVGASNVALLLEPGARFTGSTGSLSLANNSYFEGYREGASGKQRYFGARVTGARASGVGAINAGFDPAVWFFDVRSDDADVGTDFMKGIHVREIFGGSATKGGRITAYFTSEHQGGATNASNGNRHYVAVQASTYGASDGGTLGNEKGAYFGLGGAIYLPAAAQYVLDATNELNSFTHASALVKYLSPLSIVGNDAARGTAIHCAIRIGAQAAISGEYTGHIGWTSLFGVTDANGADPTYASSWIFRTFWQAGGVRTIAGGFDFTGFNVTGEYIKATYAKFSNSNLTLGDSGGNATITVNGASANGNLILQPKAAGNVCFGTYTNTPSAVTGYITIADAGGTLRKLAVIA